MILGFYLEEGLFGLRTGPTTGTNTGALILGGPSTLGPFSTGFPPFLGTCLGPVPLFALWAASNYPFALLNLLDLYKILSIFPALFTRPTILVDLTAFKTDVAAEASPLPAGIIEINPKPRAMAPSKWSPLAKWNPQVISPPPGKISRRLVSHPSLLIALPIYPNK